jgi:excisionase family DNA binding protein
MRRQSLGTLRPSRGAELPGVQLHREPVGRPLFGRELEEAGVVVELDRALLCPEHDPRTGGVVFGDREAVPHERMFAQSRTGRDMAESPRSRSELRPNSLSASPVASGDMEVIPTQHVLLTPAETASLLRVDRRTVYRWGSEGRLDVVRLSPHTRRYRASSVAALIEATGEHQKVVPATEASSCS